MAELTPQEVTELVEFGEAHALADWVRAIPPDVAREWGGRVEQIGSAIATRVAFGNLWIVNRVIGLGTAEPATEAMVDEIVELYRPAGVDFAVQLAPGAQPPELPAWLEARGLKRSRNWAKFYRDVEAPPDIPTDLRIEQIGAEERAIYVAAHMEGFGMPPALAPMVEAYVGRPGWKQYLAFDGDRAVAAAALFVHDGVGSLFGASTLPAYRRRGAQGALMARRIRDAAAAGCRWVVTETGEDSAEDPNPSYHNMVRTGFRLAYLRPNYMYQASAGA